MSGWLIRLSVCPGSGHDPESQDQAPPPTCSVQSPPLPLPLTLPVPVLTLARSLLITEKKKKQSVVREKQRVVYTEEGKIQTPKRRRSEAGKDGGRQLQRWGPSQGGGGLPAAPSGWWRQEGSPQPPEASQRCPPLDFRLLASGIAGG